MEYIRKQFVTKKPTSVKLNFSKVYTLSKGQSYIDFFFPIKNDV